MSSDVPGSGTTPALEVRGELLPRFDEILTADALAFLGELTRQFGARRAELLQARAARYAAGNPGDDRTSYRDGGHPRRPVWQVAPPAPGWPTAAAR